MCVYICVCGLTLAFQLEDLTSSVYLYAGVFVCLLLFYEFGRTRVLQVYYPKTMGKYIRRLRIHAPDKPSKTLFSWPFKILSFMSQPDDCTIKYLGMDALMFLRFVWLCFKFFLTIAVPSLAILVPIFSSGVAEDAGGMDTYSMSNVVDGSNRLWAPVVAAYVFTYFFLGALTAEYLHFVQLRKTYVAQRIANSGPVNGTMIKQHSVMVENVPEKYRNDVALKAFFGKLFPGQVVNAVVVQEIGELEKLLERREVCLANLERCVARREGGIRINKVREPEGRVKWSVAPYALPCSHIYIYVRVRPPLLTRVYGCVAGQPVAEASCWLHVLVHNGGLDCLLRDAA